MHYVLVSACLLGEPVRFDGAHKRASSPVLGRWLAEGRVVSLCPELAGGLTVPRPAAQITAGGDGAQVLAARARVVTAQGADLSAAFVHGAEQALQLARRHGVRVAVLKEGSPSCGPGFIHDGAFSGRRVAGSGVTAALLRDAGIAVFSEAQFDAADAMLQSQPPPGVK